jgi:hypothetical protein
MDEERAGIRPRSRAYDALEYSAQQLVTLPIATADTGKLDTSKNGVFGVA